MQCPYCRHPLEPLIIQGRHTGAFQCVHCYGSWLQFQQLSGLLGPSEGSNSGALVPWQGPHSLQAGSHGPLSSPWPSQRTSWSRLDPASDDAGGPAPSGANPQRRRAWWRRDQDEPSPSHNPDWDVCSYCSQLHPGQGRTCVHCNVERMLCPQCGALMIGVRRYQVLVDLCLRCHGLFFEKGRLESLIARMQGLSDPGTKGLEAGNVEPPRASLLQQLAAFLESTERDPYSAHDAENQGLFRTVGAAIGAGFGGSRRVLYDLLVMLGDIQTPHDRKPRS